jgi:two-component system sensor histidine kinase UhpB
MIEQNRPDTQGVNWRGFSLQLFLITVLPLTVLLLVVAFGSQSLHQQAMRSLVGDRDLQAVRAAASSLDHEVSYRASTIQVEARSLNGRTDLSSLILSPVEVAVVFDQGLTLFTTDGKVVGTTNSSIDWQGVLTKLPGYLEMVVQKKGQPVFSKPFSPGASNNAVVMVGSLSGNQEILVGVFSPSALIREAVSSLVSAGQTTVLVVTPGQGGDGLSVLFRAGPYKADERSLAHPGMQEALNGESGINYFQSGQGEHVVAFSPIVSVGWGLVIEEAWEDISSPYLTTTQEAPLVIIPVFLLALVALWFGARRIVQPLQALEKKAAELAKGDFTAIQEPVGGIPEIRRLQAQLIDMAHRLNAAQHSLHGYIGAITAGIENERQNLARELHDDTIQALIALNQRLQLSAISGNDPQNQASENELRKLVQQTMVNLRRIIRGLRPIYLEDLGLVAALGMLGQEVSQAAGLPVDFQVNGAERRLEPAIELAIYRIAQEALNNVVRHADAKHVWMGINYASTSLHLSVKDDGKGFVVPDQPGYLSQGGHFGLLGLRERAELIKGDLEVTSSPGAGTTVSVRLDYPLKVD